MVTKYSHIKPVSEIIRTNLKQDNKRFWARPELCGKIIQYMDNYEKFLPQLRKQTLDLTNQFFSADVLLDRIK
jgi:hypothetical protein